MSRRLRTRRIELAGAQISRLSQSRIEMLEDRALLSSASVFLAGELQVQTDGDETVFVQVDPANTTRLQVLIDGANAVGLPNLLTTQLTSLVISTGDAENVVNLSGVTQAAFPNLANIEINTGNGHDSIIGSPDLIDRIDAGDGNDTINGQGGGDFINAGDGNDSVLGGAGADEINAGDGNDIVQGELGNDTIDAGDGHDTVGGGLDNDSIIGGDGTDTLSGDAGNDFVVGNAGNDLLTGAAGLDTIFGGAGQDSLTGDADNDWLKGNGGNDLLSGGTENDSLEGDGGNDTLNGDTGNDTLLGGLGNDSMQGGNDNDTLFGGGGDDGVFGDSSLIASTDSGNDLLNGNSGNDTVVGGVGIDIMSGGEGNDLVQSGFANDVPVAPPVPAVPVPPPPPPPTSAGNFDPAIATVQGVAVAGLNATLVSGVGDGSLSMGVDGFGNFQLFAIAFDPFGPQGPSDPSLAENHNISISGPTGFQRIGFLGTPTTFFATSTEAQSTFTSNGLNFSLVQNVKPLVSTSNTQMGTIVTQTYTVTNPGAAVVQLGFERGQHWHLANTGNGFSGFNDGAARVVLSAGTELLVETSLVGLAALPVDFIGITGFGGDMSVPDRYDSVDAFAISPNGPLADSILNDANNDGFVDAGQEGHYGQDLRNYFTVNAGGTITYTTHTLFGSGALNTIADNAVAPPNVLPVATSDSVQAIGGFPVTIDVVSNDTDSDGALVFSSVQIVTQPANGTAVSLGNGLVVYTPNAGFSGVDTFTYAIADNNGGISAPVTVTVNVAAADQAGDSAIGGNGDDTLIGNQGNDTLNGQAGNDSINGSGGNDIIFGGAGRDSLNGGTGNDSLTGNSGNDTLDGGADDDSLTWRGAADSSDVLSSSSGYDSVLVQGTSSDDVFAVQGAGSTLVVTQGTATLTVDSSIRDVRINGSGGNDIISVQNISSVGLSSLTINGDAGNDFLNATNSGDSNVLLFINGGLGDDALRGGAGRDFLNGDDGNDVLFGRAGDDLLNGGLGDDVLNAEDGNDVFDGGEGNDNITGGAGNDVGTGGNDNDSVDGETGNDSISGGLGSDTLVGAAGDDSVSGELGSDFLFGGGGNDTLDGGRNDDSILGNSGNDLIRGDHGADSINGGVGDDTINAGDGDDIVFGLDGFDLIDAGDGNDFVSGGNQSDSILGGDGNDTLIGGGAADVLLGEQGDDILRGGFVAVLDAMGNPVLDMNGDPVVIGGNDTGSGGEGADDVTSPLASIENIIEDFELSSELIAALNA